MKSSIKGLLGTTAVATLMSLSPAYAAWDGTVTANGCPNTTTLTTHGGVKDGSATDCNLVITFNPDGSISTSGPGGNYDGSEDALLGVVNHSGHVVTSFNIAGPFIFSNMEPGGLSSDGIGAYIGFWNALDTNPVPGYGGPYAWFTNVNLVADSGTVNFAGIPNGGTSFFSLEEAISLASPPVITPGLPEPATLALFGAGLIGLGVLRWRKAKKP